MPGRGLVLELACGSLQHALHFAAAMPGLTWQPTDADPAVVDQGVAMLANTEGTPANVKPPLRLEVCNGTWPLTECAVVYAANLLHISPATTQPGLFKGAGRYLDAAGPVFIYGPFKVAGSHVSEGNARFDDALRAQNPVWGIRDVQDVADAAAAFGFTLAETVPMPANNLLLKFQRSTRGIA
jgi:hypothetical protein